MDPRRSSVPFRGTSHTTSAVIDNSTGFCSSRARENAAAPHGSQATAFEAPRRQASKNPVIIMRGAPPAVRRPSGAHHLGRRAGGARRDRRALVFNVLAARHVAGRSHAGRGNFRRNAATLPPAQLWMRRGPAGNAAGARGAGPAAVRFAFLLALAVARCCWPPVYSGLIVSAKNRRRQAAIGVAPSSLPEGDPRRARSDAFMRRRPGC